MSRQYELRYVINKKEVIELRRKFVAYNPISAISIYKSKAELPEGGKIYVREVGQETVFRFENGVLTEARKPSNDKFLIPMGDVSYLFL